MPLGIETAGIAPLSSLSGPCPCRRAKPDIGCRPGAANPRNQLKIWLFLPLRSTGNFKTFTGKTEPSPGNRANTAKNHGKFKSWMGSVKQGKYSNFYKLIHKGMAPISCLCEIGTLKACVWGEAISRGPMFDCADSQGESPLSTWGFRGQRPPAERNQQFWANYPNCSRG